jgi:hypothetical protein
MKTIATFLLLSALAWDLRPAAAAPAGPAPAAPAAASKPAVASAQPEIPQSVFVAPASPKEGRNPFFPQSAQVVQPSKPIEDSLPSSAFVLQGITSPPKRTAVINGYTFQIGESHEVKIASGGKVLVKCEDIGDASAAIVVNGQRHQLRMRFAI